MNALDVTWFRRARHPLRTLVLLAIAVTCSAPGALAQSKEELQREGRENERQRREREEAAQAALREVAVFAAEVEATVNAVTELENYAAEFVPRWEALLTNDDGKRIASDSTAFFTYLRICDEPGVDLDQIRVQRQAIASIRHNVQTELQRDNVGYVPDIKVRIEVRRIDYWARQALATLSQHNGWLKSVAEKTPPDLDLSAMRTLDAVVREYNAQRLKLWGRAREAGEREAQEEAEPMLTGAAREAEWQRQLQERDQLLKKARIEIEEREAYFEAEIKELEARTAQRISELERSYKDTIAELERQRKASEVRREADDVDAKIERDRLAAETEKKKLREECRTPEVTQVLAPFITPGYWQPTGTGLTGRKTSNCTGMSFKAIMNYGALEPGDRGVVKLYNLACTLTNDRPRWAGAARNEPVSATLGRLSAAQIEKIKTAQKYLIRLGPTLVEEGLLAE